MQRDAIVKAIAAMNDRELDDVLTEARSIETPAQRRNRQDDELKTKVAQLQSIARKQK